MYQQHARECRKLARGMVKPAHRDQLLALAEMWEQLARDREKLTRRHPEPFIQGESHPAR